MESRACVHVFLKNVRMMMRKTKNISAIHIIVGGLTLILTALIVLFLGGVVDCVASDLGELDCRNRSKSGAAVALRVHVY